MQTANILLALGGDAGNTVPKYNVTAAEIAVLAGIHGHDAITEVFPTGEISRSHREELERLSLTYGAARNSENVPIIKTIYPGAGARVFVELAELGLAPSQFAATARVTTDGSVQSIPVVNVAPATEELYEDEPEADDEPYEEIAEEAPAEVPAEKPKAAKKTKAAKKAEEGLFA